MSETESTWELDEDGTLRSIPPGRGVPVPAGATVMALGCGHELPVECPSLYHARKYAQEHAEELDSNWYIIRPDGGLEGPKAP